ncbi:hypothetical protein [Modicisalibacter tunisiensis]|uniref:Phenylalanine--tRNA ligase subunit alpha n=1 Tax=Modicisalibacter tunisiensis TaxID=390637 RepID=A0ABS7X0U9_9GAMM|nr:hypothetical protein [Modicisalibacter tunisiensis]MBZ9568510.1 hypothetical protein [Modicisalibacter tunisiensis]
MTDNNVTPLPSELHAAASQAVDDALAELASLPATARYQVDLERFGSPEGALKAVAMRAREAQALLEAAKAIAKQQKGE